MDQEKALKVLIDAANLAQSKGVFTLKDAVIVAKAIECFATKQEEVNNIEVVE